jgi:hypothetical protein
MVRFPGPISIGCNGRLICRAFREADLQSTPNISASTDLFAHAARRSSGTLQFRGSFAGLLDIRVCIGATMKKLIGAAASLGLARTTGDTNEASLATLLRQAIS